MFLHVRHSVHMGEVLCPRMHHRSHDQRGSLSRGVAVQGGSLSRGSLYGGRCMGGLCLGVVSVWKVSVQGGSLSRRRYGKERFLHVCHSVHMGEVTDEHRLPLL